MSCAAELKTGLKAARCELPLLSPSRCRAVLSRAGVTRPQKERSRLTGPWHVGEQSSFTLYARAFVVGGDKSGWHGRMLAFARTPLVLNNGVFKKGNRHENYKKIPCPFAVPASSLVTV